MNEFKITNVKGHSDYTGKDEWIEVEYQNTELIYIDVFPISIEIKLEEAKKLRDFLNEVLDD